MIFSDKGERYSRDRLKVEQIIVPQATSAVTRFLELVSTAYGPTARKYFNEHYNTLEKLQCRPVYLFSMLQVSVSLRTNPKLMSFRTNLL